MKKFYTKTKDIKPLSEIPPNSTLLWENDKFAVYYIYDIYNGEVQWVLVNKTYEKKFVSLLRGAVMENHGQTYVAPKYILGNAYADVYFGNHMSYYITDLNDVNIHALGILKSPSGQRIVGAVFALPPKGVIVISEYGFIGLKSIEAELLEVIPENLNMYLIFYDHNEIISYEDASGVKVQAPPNPYTVLSFQFKIDNIGTIMTHRMILEIPLEISQNFVDILTSIVHDIKKFFHGL